MGGMWSRPCPADGGAMCYLKESCMVDCSDELQISKERDYLRSVVEQIHVDTHDALTETGVRSLPSLEERAQQWIDNQDDGVTHPNWYARFDPEPLDVLMKWEKHLGLCEMSAIQYIVRHDAKNGADDIHKAIFYLNKILAEKYGE